MRTLIILTLFVYWGCLFVTSSSQVDEDIDLENESDVNRDDEEENYNDTTDDDDYNENSSDIEAEEDDEPLKGDEIDDTSDADIAFEVTTPFNFLRYPSEPEHIQKYPRFAVLRRNRL